MLRHFWPHHPLPVTCYPNALLRLVSATSRLRSHWSPTPGPGLQPSCVLVYLKHVMDPHSCVFLITLHTDGSASPLCTHRDSCLTRISLATISFGNHFLVFSLHPHPRTCQVPSFCVPIASWAHLNHTICHPDCFLNLAGSSLKARTMSFFLQIL